MPLYELFCLAKTRMSPQDVGTLMKQTGRLVLSRGGVVTDVKSFGKQELAYTIRRPGERHNEANMWQITFKGKPEIVKETEESLRLNEGVIRWVVRKRREMRELPSSYRVARMAEESFPEVFEKVKK